MKSRLAIVFTIFLLFSMDAFGQAEAGSISGTVRDSSGAVLVGATVSARNLATSAVRTAQTGNLGQYTIPGLTPGTYDVTVTSSGFATYQTRAEVAVGGTSTVDAQLSLSKESTTVEVVAEGGATVNTQTQELSQVIGPQQVTQLPSLTRTPYDFVGVAGNVSSAARTASGGDQNTTGRGVGYAINGQRTSGTEILLDGVENEDLFNAQYGQQIPIDAVQEFRVVTSNFDAQYGRASGGVINLTTKTGTNTLHGSAWEFNRLSAYTANTYANDAQNAAAGSIVAPKGGYTRNQFGYSIGGPILKNKLFFFQTTEWTRVRSNATEQAYVPTPEFLGLAAPNVQDYFNTYGKNNFNFASVLTKQTQNGVPVVGSASGTPGGPFSTIPDGTPVFGLVNFAAPADAGGDLPQNTHRIVGRLDFNMTDRTQMFFRYGLENTDDFNGSFFASPYPQYDVGQTTFNNSGLYSLSHS